MSEEELNRLIPHLFARSDLPMDESDEPQEYWDAVARSGVLNENDAILLAMSPINRARFRFAERKIRQAFFREVANLNNAPRLLLATASDARSAATFDYMDSFELRIAPSGPVGWAIKLRVKNPSLFPPGANLELIDEAGRVWVSDMPDDEGWVAALWEFDDNPNRYPGRLNICVDGVAISK